MITTHHPINGQSYLDLEQKLKDLIEKENDLIAKRQDRSMKYALESLPELIGENQFRDLCIALGVDTVIQLPSGHDLASIIRAKVLHHHDQMGEQRRQRQIERLI